MKVCMVVYNLEEFGGLEENVTTLAIHLQQLGHQIAILSTGWVPPNNQYAQALRQQAIPLVHLPQWLAAPLSDWPTKEQMLRVVMQLARPLVFVLGTVLCLIKQCTWRDAQTSAFNWLRGQLMARVIGPDRREPFVRLLLQWWHYRWQSDLLHLHGFHSHTNSLLFVVAWARAQAVPVIYQENQTPDLQFDSWQAFRQKINLANLVVAASARSETQLRAVGGVTCPMVVIGPIVADPAARGQYRNQQAHLNKANLNKTNLRVIAIARLHIMKGLIYLLEAIAQIQKTHPTTDFRIYGDGPLREELSIYADQLGLDVKTIFAGVFARHELPDIMRDADIFVTSSIIEALPLNVIEAMAYGLPIVATNVGGIPEIIHHNQNGLLCPAQAPTCLAENLRRLLDEPALRTKLGEAARHDYEQGPFQAVSIAQQFLTVYQQVLAGDEFHT